MSRLAKTMKRGEGDAAALARSYKKTQAAASRTAAALERQRSAFIGAKRGLREAYQNVPRLLNPPNDAERTAAALRTHRKRDWQRLMTPSPTIEVLVSKEDAAGSK